MVMYLQKGVMHISFTLGHRILTVSDVVCESCRVWTQELVGRHSIGDRSSSGGWSWRLCTFIASSSLKKMP